MASSQKKIGLTVDAIRFYERNGMLPPPPRIQGGFRKYGENDVETLAFVRRVQGLGIKLSSTGNISSPDLLLSEQRVIRSATDLCSALPRIRRRVGADPISFGARFGANDRTVPWLQTADSISRQ